MCGNVIKHDLGGSYNILLLSTPERLTQVNLTFFFPLTACYATITFTEKR